MDMTLQELAGILDPAMTASQVRTLAWLAHIEPSGRRRTGDAGRPAVTFDVAAIQRAHAQEAARTSKQFSDTDWIASALLDRKIIRADPERGEVWWSDGRRAERLRKTYYGYIRAASHDVAAHRVIWIAGDGEIPPGLQINHRNRLRWDNRRANLELVTHRHNIRHAHGLDYLTHHQAVTQLAMVPPPLPEVPTMDNMTRAGGVFQR